MSKLTFCCIDTHSMIGRISKCVYCVAGAALFVFLLSGCRLMPASEVASENGYQVETVKMSSLKIWGISVSKGDGKLEVRGKIKKRALKRSWPFQGHVDVSVFSPSGELLKKVGVYYYPRSLSRRSSSNFKAMIPLIPAAGSTIEVKYHNFSRIPKDELRPTHKLESGPDEGDERSNQQD